jgi:methylenetetrahydrofolate reductase (NADPH)
MRIGETYKSGKLGLSFELFPPKTPVGDEALYRNLDEMMHYKPDFVTCTYGAGGSTQTKTLDICETVNKRYGVSVASHLTCVGSTVDDLRNYLKEAQSRGVENIIALRGDPPKGETSFQVTSGGLRWASELVKLIRTEFPQLGMAVAGYPETHQEAISPADDLQNLKRKVDAGGDAVITQLFYINDDFFRWRDAAQKLGITVPIVPGILPITNFAQVKRIATLCKACLPDGLVSELERVEDNEEAQFELGIAHAVRQVEELIRAGIPGVHFYVLNKSAATLKVLEAVGLKR